MLEGDFANCEIDSLRLSQGWGPSSDDLRKALLLNGVDLMRTAGFTSAAHTEDDIEQTVEAFEASIARMQRRGFSS